MTHRRAQRSKQPRITPKSPAAAAGSLQNLEQVQEQLERISQLQRQAVEARRQAVADAWRSGATAKDLAATLKISLAKVYTLLPPR